ncbi:hypothetical protein Acr_06g0005530 [Actinidia rufa]|uniref:Uncharacterized protein n=1 Tax=Actinidia rufa TaxID=165716 RepID=A0A7J0EQB1_9ERIC|nr:hypothetical protein Acr_06g0005530 [Actinidia rufa]
MIAVQILCCCCCALLNAAFQILLVAVDAVYVAEFGGLITLRLIAQIPIWYCC